MGLTPIPLFRLAFRQGRTQNAVELSRKTLVSMSFVLRTAALGDIAAFPFVEAPDKRNIQDGVRLLQVVDKKTSIMDAFRIADDALRQGVQGMYQPDAISHYQANGSTYLATANEGDSREWLADETAYFAGQP